MELTECVLIVHYWLKGKGVCVDTETTQGAVCKEPDSEAF